MTRSAFHPFDLQQEDGDAIRILAGLTAEVASRWTHEERMAILRHAFGDQLDPQLDEEAFRANAPVIFTDIDETKMSITLASVSTGLMYYSRVVMGVFLHTGNGQDLPPEEKADPYSMATMKLWAEAMAAFYYLYPLEGAPSLTNDFVAHCLTAAAISGLMVPGHSDENSGMLEWGAPENPATPIPQAPFGLTERQFNSPLPFEGAEGVWDLFTNAIQKADQAVRGWTS